MPLPELLSNEASADPSDIKIRFGKVEPYPRQLDESGCGFWVQGNLACHYLQGVGAFLVSAGQHIIVDPHPDVAEEALRLSILGPALALALHQRGLYVLHASAVSVAGTAVAFLGGHGWGKSTMAAVLHARGFPVISDDLTALETKNNMVFPSFPRLKLWPDAIRTLNLCPEELPQVHPDVPKRALRLTAGFALNPLPLRRLYVLAIGQSTAIEVLRRTQGLEEIISHWYGARFGSTFFHSLDLREHFQQSSQLATVVPVRRLRRPATLRDDPSLPEVIEREILRDLESS